MKRLSASILITAALLLGAAALMDARQRAEAAPVMAALSVEETPSVSSAPAEEGFVLAEYGGRVAVYSPGQDAGPGEITSIWVRFLPGADRQALQTGIPADSAMALAALLEDLGS